MSAIAKPHMYFSGASGNQATVPIPVDWIYSMDKRTETASTLNNNTAAYYIDITLVPAVGTATRIEKIKFDTQAHRDASFTNALTLIGAPIANT